MNKREGYAVTKKASMRLSVLLLCILLAVSFTVLGCGNNKVDTSKETYKIGAVLSLSGPAAP